MVTELDNKTRVLEILCHSSQYTIKRNDTCLNPSIVKKLLTWWRYSYFLTRHRMMNALDKGLDRVYNLNCVSACF